MDTHSENLRDCDLPAEEKIPNTNRFKLILLHKQDPKMLGFKCVNIAQQVLPDAQRIEDSVQMYHKPISFRAQFALSINFIDKQNKPEIQC